MLILFSTLFRYHGSDELVTAQVAAFKQRIPILYSILAINTGALAIAHLGTVSDVLTVFVPGAFVLFIAVRLGLWYRLRSVLLDADEARRLLMYTTVVAVGLSVSMLVWGIALYIADTGVADHVSAKAHVILYIGLTVICCATLLMHLRHAATLITLTVTVPFSVFLAAQGTLVESAIAVNLALVSASMLFVIVFSSRDFRNVVLSRVELKKLYQQQTELANTDALTGLPNRRHFFAVLERATAHGDPYALLVVDLDGFKQVNDVYGHVVGDQVLAETGRRIVACLPQNATVARLGGDEFGVFLHGRLSPSTVGDIGMMLVRACSEPVRASDLILRIGASVGANLIEDGETFTNFVKNYERADYALFHAKQLGKGRVEMFSPTHEECIKAKGQLEQALKAADFRRELSVVYQPVVRADDLQIVAFEALARWNSPRLGQVSPALFIPVAEATGIISAITEAVLDKVLEDASLFPRELRLKVNLSVRDLASSEQILRLIAMVRHSRISPSRLSFEITESALMNDLEAVNTALSMIRALGISVAIDDFGTGYSSLSYIHRVRPNVIKIDRSFTSALTTDETARSVVRSIIDLSANVGARCIAEGTETPAQVEALRNLGCAEFQGFYFGRPEPIENALQLLKADKQREEARSA